MREMESYESTEKYSILFSFPNSWYSRTTKILLQIINDEQEQIYFMYRLIYVVGHPVHLAAINKLIPFFNTITNSFQ